jgi:hypothetical protein
VCPSTIRLLDWHAPSLGADPLPCALFVEIVVTSRERFDGVIQLIQCTHVVESRQFHSLCVLPSHLALAQTQPKSLLIILRKVRCVPHWCRLSPSCGQGDLSHTPNFFVRPIDRSLPCALCSSVVESAQVCALYGCQRRPLHPPPLLVVFIPCNIHRLPWHLFPSPNLITTQKLFLPQPLSSR